MFGLPQDIFGVGPFGVADWAPMAIYKSVPLAHRVLDAQEGYPLRKYFEALQGEATDLLGAMTELLEQRQPLLARDGALLPLVTVTATTAAAQTVVDTVAAHGFHVGQRVVFAGTEASTPPIRGVQLVAQVLSATQFTIDFTTTVGSATGYCQDYNRSSVPVWVTSAVAVVDADYGPTIEFEFENGTNLAYLGVGYTAVFTVGGVDYSYEVARLRTRNADDSAATRNGALCYGMSVPDATVVVPPYLLWFQQPSALQYLTADFGLIYDDNDPQFFRRSLVRNVAQYVMQKASQKGYQIRGNVAGFNVTAQSLYALDASSAPTGLPSGSVFLYSGGYYTSIPPRRFHFDEIPADIEFIDPESGASVYPMDELLYTDGSVDGFSPAYSVAQCVTENYVGTSGILPIALSSTAASPATLATYSLPYGYEVVVQFASADDHAAFTVLGAGTFALSGPSGAVPEEQYFIEAELAWNVGLLQATYLIGIPANTIPVGVAESYCILYAPPVLTDCAYCKSYRIRVVANPTARLYADLGGSGVLVNDALERLLVKLRREQLPIHAAIAEAVLEVVASATLSPTATIVVT